MSTSTDVSIVWFRHDLRLSDNPALHAAVQRGAVVPVFIWSPEEEGDWPLGGASKWWLHQSLTALDESLAKLGAKLVIRKGAALKQLQQVIRETKASAAFWNRRYEPAIIARDKQIKEHLRGDSIEAESFNGSLLLEPWTITNKAGKPFQVFTPFWKACLSVLKPTEPLPAHRKLVSPSCSAKSLSLDDLELEPKIDWARGLRETWHPGEHGAQRALRHFQTKTIYDYTESRNFPDRIGTSRLSPHLHFGEISPRQVLAGVEAAAKKKSISQKAWHSWQFVTELGWREFAHHLLYHFPQTPTEPLRPEFKKFPWRDEPDWLKTWQRGQTGYPIVDAGMRELWHTGWMHNRVRMIVASFLIKDLMLPWQEGARWFWDTLVDADLANNTLGWQWTAGCGADAAPFFRIFNPVTQGEKFDPQGNYVRRWVPEIARLPDKSIHQPWNAPAAALAQAGITLGKNYPEPLVNHSIAREVALEAYKKL